MTNSETEQYIRDIKKDLRAAMNGILSAKMREAGAPYKLIFGVELPRLMSIASEYPKDCALAQALWNENIRESKLLACMLMPEDTFSPELADIWASEIPTAEVAQVLAMYTLCRTAHAADTAFRWIASSCHYKQLCGLLCITRLMRTGTTLNEHSSAELHDQASSLLPAADIHLRKAITVTLEALDADT